MDTKLVEHLQSLKEEDLFPEASEEEVKKRGIEARKRYLEQLSKFRIGDEVRTKLGRLRGGQSAKIVEIDPNRKPYPIRVEFSTGLYLNIAPDELEKI